ncbi:putative exonuclease RecB type protein [Rhizobium phage RHph_Y55]|nr:putative exonuclease RecB type protein [Rhizobium phage RHph_Y55]
MVLKHAIVDRIDQAYQTIAAAEPPFRNHLGGSMIGKNCERELMYSFRWSVRPSFDGRMLRLFERGHKEEFRFVNFLRMIGMNVREYAERLLYDPHFEGGEPYRKVSWDHPLTGGIDGREIDVTGDVFHMERAKKAIPPIELKQWRISDVEGHFGGSLDGIADAPFDIPVDVGTSIEALLQSSSLKFIPAGTEFLLEFKTHNTKSFCKLVAEGVKAAKPIHWAQMQIYMHKKGLGFAVYVAVNKNDDDLWIEVVEYDPAEGPKLLERAARVIHARTLPPRVGKHPSWHECKFCDYAKQCHYSAPLEKNCRTCKHATPVEDGQWRCGHWNAIIPSANILEGCDSYSVITD